MNKPTRTAIVVYKSWLEQDLNSHLRVSGPLLYQFSYRVNWEQYSRFIHFKCTRDPRDKLALAIREDVQCFDSISKG